MIELQYVACAVVSVMLGPVHGPGEWRQCCMQSLGVSVTQRNWFFRGFVCKCKCESK